MKTWIAVLAVVLIGVVSLSADAAHWVVQQADGTVAVVNPAEMRTAARLQRRADRHAAKAYSSSCDMAASCDVAVASCDLSASCDAPEIHRVRLRRVRVYETAPMCDN